MDVEKINGLPVFIDLAEGWRKHQPLVLVQHSKYMNGSLPFGSHQGEARREQPVFDDHQVDFNRAFQCTMQINH